MKLFKLFLVICVLISGGANTCLAAKASAASSANKNTDKALLEDKEKLDKQGDKSDKQENNNSAKKIKTPVILTSFADIIEPLMPSVVNIYTLKYPQKNKHGSQTPSEVFPFNQFNDFFEQFNVPFTFEDLYSNPRLTPLGSGLVIEPSGLIVTNHHVVAGADEVNVKFNDNTELPGLVIGSDPKTDLALIKVDSKKDLIPAVFGDSTKAKVGDVVIAIGNPLGYGGTVTTGIISSKGRDLGAEIDELVDDFIQTDAAINIGNSGGPLFNLNGEVIGINSAIPAAGGGTNIGIGFAIPSNTVTDIISKLKLSGKVHRGRLDINVQDVTSDLAEALSLNYNYGVLVVDAPNGGVGFNAGLRRGDVILEFNNQKVLNARKLKLFVADCEIGSKVKLAVVRDGKITDFNVEIIDSEFVSESQKIKKKEASAIEVQGIVISNLSASYINNFELDPEISGVVVSDVTDSMPDIDIKIGDVIISIDQTKIENTEQFLSVYQDLKNGKRKNSLLLVRRGDFSFFVAIPLL